MIEAVIRAGDTWRRFQEPLDVLVAWNAEDVRDVIGRAETYAVRDHRFAIGFVSYEASAAFGLAVSAPPASLPLAWFAIFAGAGQRFAPSPGDYNIVALRPSVDTARFGAAFNRITQHLADGDTYQVNYTFRMRGGFAGNAEALFADLAAAQDGAYGAYIRTGRHSICSASPELFFAREGERLVARPMKGTERRGRTLAEDRERAARLVASPKQRAENVMIVDMVRNDLGRVAATGTVEVPELFTVERYPTVWQLTSQVTAQSTAPLAEVFAALHPSASVTGAPKVRTMELIRDLEGEPRGVYTGAIGYIAPGGDARFNVAIRTAVIDHERAVIEFGVGSGIVWESTAEAEYEECLLKARVVGWRPGRFDLLETIRWTPPHAGDDVLTGFFLLDRHLERLAQSAEYFGYACSTGAARRTLERAVAGCTAPRRVRLLVSRSGEMKAESTALVERNAPASVRLAQTPIHSTDVFLFHKTTNRRAYEERRKAIEEGIEEGTEEGIEDVILWNERGEVTESTIANVVVERGGERVTPPVSCGLLAGTFRAELLAKGEVREAIVPVDELARAPRVWLVNSVHGWREARVTRSRLQHRALV